MNILVALYADLELYPPSLNAVYELAERVDHVHVVKRGLGYACAKLPSNVTVTSPVNRDGELGLDSASKASKIYDFARYVRCIRELIQQEDPALIVAYDPIPLMAIRLAGMSESSRILWYHNHDKEAQNTNSALSLGWWAYATEGFAFRRINFFSLPAMERLPLFATRQLKTAPLLLPNYPSRRRVGRGLYERPIGVLRLVYQGSLGREHGFQEIIPWLGRQVCGKRLHLTLVGKIKVKFRSELLELAEAHGVSEWFAFREFVPFTELPRVLETFNVGLAIHKPIGVTYSTGGTACNKIYEYAAAGLPVVLYDSEHYREHLDGRSWVAFCKLTWDSFSDALESLVENLDGVASEAIDDVSTSLNFEAVFPHVWDQILPILRKQG